MRIESMDNLPEFKTPEEFSDFFETHSLNDYWAEFEEVTDIEFARPTEAQKVIPVIVNDALFSELRTRAAKEGVSLSALAGRWLVSHARELKQTNP